ncbi:MAG: helix-turn-helix transcriptional regulator [Phycisphaerae bacterium]
MARGDTLFRQWELIKVLQANRFGLSTEELASRLECSQRTVQRDVSVLRDIFPISYRQGPRGLRYWKLETGTVESDKLELTMTEMLSLFLSQQLLLPLSGTQFGDGLQTAIQKIRAMLPERALNYFEKLDESFFIKNLANHDYSGLRREIRTLNEAILDQQAVKVTYNSASRGREVITEFHPYGMVLLQSSLYCIGYLACHEEVRTLKVARIRQVSRLRKGFEKPLDFSLAGHLRGAFGVFKSGRSQKIRARLSDWAARSVREMQWHPSQRIVKDNGKTVEAVFELSGTVEFKRSIMGFGRYAKVLSPKSLAEDIRREHMAAGRQY